VNCPFSSLTADNGILKTDSPTFHPLSDSRSHSISLAIKNQNPILDPPRIRCWSTGWLMNILCTRPFFAEVRRWWTENYSIMSSYPVDKVFVAVWIQMRISSKIGSNRSCLTTETLLWPSMRKSHLHSHGNDHEDFFAQWWTRHWFLFIIPDVLQLIQFSANWVCKAVRQESAFIRAAGWQWQRQRCVNPQILLHKQLKRVRKRKNQGERVQYKGSRWGIFWCSETADWMRGITSRKFPLAIILEALSITGSKAGERWDKMR
jgi:hypothetical protein